MENVLKNLKSSIRVSKDLEKALESVFKMEHIDKKEMLLKEGQYCRKLYFLDTGLARTYHYDKGRDISSWFYKENQFFTSSYSFLGKKPSFEYIETLDTCILYSITYDKYQQVMERYPEFQKFGRLYAESQLAFLDFYYRGYSFMSAKERYDLLILNFPNIELRVKLGHIASFLGISQETLSRVRSKK